MIDKFKLLKWLYVPRQFTGSVKSLPTCKCYFTQDWNEQFSNLYGTKKDPNVRSNVEKKNKVEGIALKKKPCVCKLKSSCEICRDKWQCLK